MESIPDIYAIALYFDKLQISFAGTLSTTRHLEDANSRTIFVVNVMIVTPSVQ